MNADFWRGKRVFITGHSGFKGGWLSLWLQRLEADLVGYALAPPTAPSFFEVANVKDGMRSLLADVRDANALSKSMCETKPDIVFHLAAQPLVRYGYQAPLETYATNVMGTVHVLEAVRRTDSVRAVINVTSDKCYENREWSWGYRESDPVGGYDPYSSSKGCAELVTAAYRNSFFSPASRGERGVALASARAGNVIGGGDWAADRLVPDILRSLQAGEPVKIRNPDAVRPWQHVLEPLSGYLSLAEKLYSEASRYADSWNFGPLDEDVKPVRWVVEHMARSWSGNASWQADPDSQPHEAQCLKLDSSKAKLKLNWKPRWNLLRALESVVAWHKALLEKKDMRCFTLMQIAEYEATHA